MRVSGPPPPPTHPPRLRPSRSGGYGRRWSAHPHRCPFASSAARSGGFSNSRVNRAAVRTGFRRSQRRVGMPDEEYFAGFLQIAERAYGPSCPPDQRTRGATMCAHYGMVVYGGAGGLHACGWPHLLGIWRILCAGECRVAQCAGGCSHAARESRKTRQILAPW